MSETRSVGLSESDRGHTADTGHANTSDTVIDTLWTLRYLRQFGLLPRRCVMWGRSLVGLRRISCELRQRGELARYNCGARRHLHKKPRSYFDLKKEEDVKVSSFSTTFTKFRE